MVVERVTVLFHLFCWRAEVVGVSIVLSCRDSLSLLDMQELGIRTEGVEFQLHFESQGIASPDSA